jgi:hypothetical protein
VFSVGPTRGYITRVHAAIMRIESSELASWQNHGKKAIRQCEIGITTMLKSVARIRLMKTDKT